MRPFKDIFIGDIYQPTRGGAEFIVVEKESDEKMVKVMLCNHRLPAHLNQGFWTKNTNRLFTNRVFCGEKYHPQEECLSF
jgi:hypothetical protein